MDFDYLVQEMKCFIMDGFNNARYAHSVLFKKTVPNLAVVMAYLAIANSDMNAAKTVYICNNDQLVRQEFDELFDNFRAFSNEVMTNIRTDHSHQWSDIHFQRFKESYESVASLLGIQQ